MAAIVLTPEARKRLRALAHHHKPIILIGQEGLSAAVVQEANTALLAHELIKIRVFDDSKETRDCYLQRLASELQAAPVQHIGKLLVLWRPVAQKVRSQIAKPLGRAAPKVIKVLKYSKRGGQRPQARTVKVLGNQRITQAGRLKRANSRKTSPKKQRLV